MDEAKTHERTEGEIKRVGREIVMEELLKRIDEKLKDEGKNLKEEIKKLKEHFHDKIPDVGENRIIQIVLVRETKSLVKFTTDGESIDTERTIAGVRKLIWFDRVCMLKRKQVSAERRTGKNMLRKFAPLLREKFSNGVLPFEKIERCALTEDLCGKCPDCFLYGYAAQEESEGSRKTRVLTDSAFTILQASACCEVKTQNAVKEKFGTERERETLIGQALWEFEYVKPNTLFPSVETLTDVTFPEFLFVLHNILKTKRYGGEKSTGGQMENHILGIYFLNEERFSNLKLTQVFYDALWKKHGEGIRDITLKDIKDVFGEVEKEFLPEHLTDKKLSELDRFISLVDELFLDDDFLKSLCEAMLQDVQSWIIKKQESEGGEKKSGRKKKKK